MHSRFAPPGDAPAPTKRAVNLTLSADVLEEAKRPGFNVSQVCDALIDSRIRDQHAYFHNPVREITAITQ